MGGVRRVRRRQVWSAVARVMVEALEERRLFAESTWAFPGADGGLMYRPTALGDHVENFGMVGYQGGTVPIPDVPVRVTVDPVAGDDTATIQAAITVTTIAGHWIALSMSIVE